MMLDEQWRAPGWGQPMSHEMRVVAWVKVDDDLSFRVRSIGQQGGYCLVEPAARARVVPDAQLVVEEVALAVVVGPVVRALRRGLRPGRGRAAADPDLILHQAGTIGTAQNAPTSACTQSWQTSAGVCSESRTASLSPGDYTLEVYEWTNIAGDPSHPSIGDTCFDVTVTGP